jgi:antitoxin component YwqK of YwqJK toxin-antitoxin module
MKSLRLPFGLFQILLVIHSVNLSIDAYAQQPRLTMEEGQRINGKKEGLWTLFYPSGNRMAIEHYREDTLEGKCRYYDFNGNPLAEENYSNGLLEDSARYYHPNGRIHRLGLYANGLYTGEWVTFDTSGQPSQLGTYSKGLPSGTWRTLDNNIITEVASYEKGMLHGLYITYEGKTLVCKGQYTYGNPSGTWYYFNRRGKIKRKVDYTL